jgi:hypothetical protein
MIFDKTFPTFPSIKHYYFRKIAVSSSPTASYGKLYWEYYTQNSKTFLHLLYEGF